MGRSGAYNTKQREAVLDYMCSLEGGHVTAGQIVEHFEKEAIPVGRTTVYRQLEKLTLDGKLRKYSIGGVSGACFQYIGGSDDCHSHLHLKCEDCGELTHLYCDMLNEIEKHVLSEHAFKLNAFSTVLYGKCDNCQHERDNELSVQG